MNTQGIINSSAYTLSIIALILTTGNLCAANSPATTLKTIPKENSIVFDKGSETAGYDTGYATTLDNKGNIVVVGTSTSATMNSLHMMLWRYKSDGALDKTFNQKGYVTFTDATTQKEDTGKALALDKTGKIIVAGLSWDSDSDQSLTIWRFNPNGTLDTTFNKIGFTTYQGPGLVEVEDIALDSSGHILVTGGIYFDDKESIDMAVWRFLPNGTLDTSFNHVGFIAHDNAAGGNGSDIGVSLVVDEKGNILVTGASESKDLRYDMAVWRITPAGNLDQSFNSKGFITHNNAGGANDNDFGLAITLDTNSNIIVSGYSNAIDSSGVFAKGQPDMAIWRLLPNGTLDVKFNHRGFVTHNNAADGSRGGIDYGNAIAINAAGKIIVAGKSETLSTNSSTTAMNMALWQYNTDGSLDTTYHNVGYITCGNTAGDGGKDVGVDLILDHLDNKIVTGYSYNTAGNSDMVIWQFP